MGLCEKCKYLQHQGKMTYCNNGRLRHSDNKEKCKGFERRRKNETYKTVRGKQNKI